MRGFLSRALGLPENRVRVMMQDVGGGFGQKMFMLPDEVAVVIGWLCTDEARLVSGTVMQLR